MDNKISNNNEYNDLSFRKYTELVDKFLSSDNRELNYQNRVIIPMLEKIFNGYELDVVDTSTLYKNWEKRSWHDRSKYAGTYTPDILIVKNWNIENNGKNDIEYIAVIEVKKPNAMDRYHATKEVNDYLNYIPNVILTDTVTWEFYTRNGIEEPETINLESDSNRVCTRGKNNKTVQWKTMGQEDSDDLACNHSGWKDLMRKLSSIINEFKTL